MEVSPGETAARRERDRSLWVCAALTVLVGCLWGRAEVLNARAGYFLPGEPRTGNAKWRLMLGETEESWRRLKQPRDESGAARPLTETELERMRSDVASAQALNTLNRWIRSILVFVYLVPPVVVVWSLLIASDHRPTRHRLAALVLAVLALSCEALVLYRLQHVELLG